MGLHLRLGLETLGVGGAPLDLGGKSPPWPPPPPLEIGSLGGRRPPGPLYKEGGGEVDGDPAARRRGGGSSGIPAGLRQAQAGMKRCHGREGGARAWGAAPMRLPTIYRGGGVWFLALQVHWGVGKGGGNKSHHFPSPPIVIPLF